MKKNCVISAVGKDSLHRQWIRGNPDFDLHLIVYDDSLDVFREDTEFICPGKGYKLWLVHEYLEAHPEYLDRYEYFFLPDDDIRMDSGMISELFEIMKDYRLQIAQPALSADSCYTYRHTLCNPDYLLRYGNHVEMMVPCFSQAAFREVLPTFNANRSGWGIEWYWPLLVNGTHREMALVDKVRVTHTRPVQSYSSRNAEELEECKKKYGLDQKYIEYGGILAGSFVRVVKPPHGKIRQNGNIGFIYQLNTNKKQE